MNSGILTPAVPKAVLKEKPLMGNVLPKSIVMETLFPPFHPTVLFCVQK